MQKGILIGLVAALFFGLSGHTAAACAMRYTPPTPPPAIAADPTPTVPTPSLDDLLADIDNAENAAPVPAPVQPQGVAPAQTETEAEAEAEADPQS